MSLLNLSLFEKETFDSIASWEIQAMRICFLEYFGTNYKLKLVK